MPRCASPCPCRLLAGSAPAGLRQLPRKGAASNDVKRQLLYKQNDDCRFADGDSRVSGGWQRQLQRGLTPCFLPAAAAAGWQALLRLCCLRRPLNRGCETAYSRCMPPRVCIAGTVYMAGAVHKQLLNEAYQMFRQGLGMPPGMAALRPHACQGPHKEN